MIVSSELETDEKLRTNNAEAKDGMSVVLCLRTNSSPANVGNTIDMFSFPCFHPRVLQFHYDKYPTLTATTELVYIKKLNR